MKTAYSSVVVCFGVATLVFSSFAEMPTPIAQWSFEDENDLGAPSVGSAELTRFTTGDGRSAQEGGRIGQSLAVYGGNGTNKAPDAWWTTTGVMPTGSSPFTVSAWLKPCSGTGANAYLFVYRTITGGVPNGYTQGSNWTGWYLRFWNSGSSLAFDFTSGWRSAVDDNQCMIVSKPSGLTYADGKWHHFAITRTADFTVSIYVDGVCLGSKKLSVNQTVPNARFGIGGQDTANNFRGNFDEVKVYDQALTAGQIVKEFYSYDPNTVVDEEGRIILDVAEGVVVTNAVSYDVGLSLAKTGAGKLIMHHGSGNFPGSIGVSNGWFRTGEQNSFRHATGFAVEEGATLEFGRSSDYAVPITGAGTLRLSGAGAFNLTGDFSGFTGLLSTYAANVDFANAPAATSSLDVGNGGFATFHDDVSLAALSGQGLLGGVALPDGKTLIVGDANNAEFAGRLVGEGKLVKNGAGTLTLSGGSEFSEVDVRSGSVALKRAVPSDQHNFWRFEDMDEIGADSYSRATLKINNYLSGKCYAKQVDGLVGKGAEVKVVASTEGSFLISDADADLPRGTSPYTFSAWIRPYSTTVGNAYIARFQNLTLKADGSYDDTGWGSTGWYLVSHNSGTKLSLSYPSGWSGDGGAASQKVTGDLPSGEYHDDKWHHVAFTLDATKALRLYWDGKKIGENLKPDRCSVSATARLQLGSYERSASHRFDGIFDEVQYVDGAWSDERIAAEYASRVPLMLNASLPTPLAHWTFDEYETDDQGRRYFADTGRSGWHLYECKNGENTVDCIDATSSQGEGVNGGAAYVPDKNTGAFLRVDSSVGIVPKDTYSTKNPDFTTSVRFRCAGNNATPRQIIFSFGSAQAAQTCMRLVKESEPTWSGNAEWVPRILRLLPGGANKNEGSVIEDTYASYGDTTPWTTITCVNKASGNKVTVYRDGVEVGTYPSAYSLDLDRIYVFAGYWANGRAYPETCTGFVVDDIRVYDGLLSPAQVKAVVYEQANVQPNGLAKTAVRLASGTTLEAKDGSFSAAAVSGAGEVKIAAAATFGAVDWADFTGAVTGDGCLTLFSKLPTGVTVAETLNQQVAGAVTDSAGTGLPLVESAGVVRIAATGVVRVTDVATGSDLAGKSFVLARAGSFLAPPDFSGWTVEPADEQVPYEFFIRGNVFRLKVKGGGMVLFVR